MGTLRIKRGTTSARTGFTPLEGELIYDTNTKEVYVGDGSTAGGIAVSVSTQNLENLGNVQSVTPQKDQILVYNGSNWAATENPALDLRGNIYADDSTLLVDAINGKIVGPIQTSSVVATTLTGTLTGDTVGSHTGSVVGNLVGTVTGDVKGSVFADDSTVMVDANNNVLKATTVNATNITGNLSGTLDGSVTGSVFGDGSSLLVDGITDTIVGEIVSPNAEIGTVHIDRAQKGVTIFGTKGDTVNPSLIFDISGGASLANSDIAGEIDFKIDGVYKAGLQARKQSLFITSDDAGTKGQTMKEDHIVYGGLKLKVEPANSDFAAPTEALEVLGNIKGTGFVQFGSLTTTQRDALTAANGMVIYNSTLNKFQGYENGTWANLI